MTILLCKLTKRHAVHECQQTHSCGIGIAIMLWDRVRPIHSVHVPCRERSTYKSLYFKFNTSTGDAPLQARSRMCHFDSPMYLHEPYHQRSFGHVIRDNFNTIVSDFHSLSVQPEAYHVLLMHTPVVERVFQHYISYVASQANTWADVLSRCAHRYIIFRQLILGNRMYSRRSKLDCAGPSWRWQRDMAYQLANLPHVPARAQERTKVLILDKEQDDKRRILNSHDLAAALQVCDPTPDINRVMLQGVCLIQSCDRPAPPRIKVGSARRPHLHNNAISCMIMVILM